MTTPYEDKKRRISLSHHGLTLENFHELLEHQDGCCKMCGYKAQYETFKELRQELHIDHNHECCHIEKHGRLSTVGAQSCGRCIRGLLCRTCNLMIAGYEKTKGTLDIAELEKYCVTEPFVFTGPMWAESTKLSGLYTDQARGKRSSEFR